MEEEFDILFERNIISVGKDVITKCIELCHEHNLTARQLVNRLLGYLETRDTSVAGAISKESAGRILTVDTLKRCFSPTASEKTPIQDHPKPTLNLNSSQPCDNKTAFFEMSLKVIKQISDSNNIKVSLALDKYLASNICIGGRVFRKRGKHYENDPSFLFKAITSSSTEREVEILTRDLETFKLFIGQIILIEGEFLGDFFVAKKIYTQTYQSLPPPLEYKDSCTIVIGAGPFPLENGKFLDYAVSLSPDYLLLFGRFTKEALDLDDFVEALMSHLKSHTKLILVPSLEDEKTFPLLPQPALALKKTHSNVMLLPNPFLIELDNILVGGSSTDVLSHLKNQELVKPDDGSDDTNIDHLPSYILQNKSFYPLYPPDEKINIDYKMLSTCAPLSNMPHVLVLCSKLKPFTKEVFPGCTAVNPGHSSGALATVDITDEGLSCHTFKL